MLRVAQVSVLLLTIMLSSCTQGGGGKDTTASGDATQPRKVAPAHSEGAPHLKGRRESNWTRDFQVAEYPGGAFSIKDPGSPPAGDAASVIQALEPLARSGNSKATFQIYQKTKECLDAIQSQTSVAAKPSDFDRSREEAVERCRNLTPDDYARTAEWLDLAASQGNLPAQLIYATDISTAVGDASDFVRDPVGLKDYKEKANNYLRSAIKNGSLDALAVMSENYQNGVMVEKDNTQSYAYLLAIAKASPDLTPKWQMKLLERDLSSSEINDAHRRSEGIFNECCNETSRNNN